MNILGYKYRSGSPLPSYVEELIPAQLAAVRVACLLAAPLLLAFVGFDRLIAPALWLQLLGVRVIAAALLLFIAAEAKVPSMPVLSLSVAANFVVCGTIELAIFGTGTFHSPYLFSPLIVLAGISILLPLRMRQAAVLILQTLLVVLGPLLVTARAAADDLAFGSAAVYLTTLAVISVAGSGVQDRLRRREHQARAEFARHAGLLNLGTLAGGLAHELSNPLNALFLQADMLARDPEHASARVEKMRGNLERMRNILEAMRNGARLSGGERRPVQLAHELDLAFTLIEGKLRHRVSMVRAYAELPPVYCQPTLLGQVLVNLLSNAADAVAPVPSPRLALRVRRSGSEALIEVEDNGPGVPPELREKIFEPFFSTKGDQGNGLGLWISSEIARLHGGSLTVHEGSAGGALFRLSLPIDPRGGPPVIETPPPEQPAA